jgi:hypothetical protein
MFNTDGSGNTRSPRDRPWPVALRLIKRPSFDMIKIYSFVGASVGSYAGWALGSLFGLMGAFMISFVGLGMGIYFGRRLAHF